MDKALHLKLVEAWWDGELEFDCDGKWIKPHYAPDEASNPAHYRIRTKPTLRPWKPEEVPVGALYRRKSQAWTAVLLPYYEGIVWMIKLESGGKVEGDYPSTCLEAGEHSTDGGKTWKPCGVEESQ